MRNGNARCCRIKPQRRPCKPNNTSLTGFSESFPHGLDDHTLGALPVELGVVDLLPGAEVQPSVSDRHNHFVMHEQAFQVRVAVGLAGAVMR